MIFTAHRYTECDNKLSTMLAFFTANSKFAFFKIEAWQLGNFRLVRRKEITLW